MTAYFTGHGIGVPVAMAQRDCRRVLGHELGYYSA